ncbi:unnamed protein product [Closterium sp. Yama58-4]|nr:unnamed protein product [Closterium sp. Yama58-4]
MQTGTSASRDTPRTPFFEGCSPSPLTRSVAAVDFLRAEEVGAASAPSGRRRSGKGKGGKGGGGGGGSGGSGSGGGGGGSGGGGGGGSGSGGGGSGGSGGGGGSGGSSGGSGGSSGSDDGGSGGGRGGAGQRGGSGGGQQQQQRPRETLTPQQLREWFAQRGTSGGSVRCPYVICTGLRTGQTCGKVGHTQYRRFLRLEDAWRTEFGDKAALPRSLDLLRNGVDVFALDYDAILAGMYALTVSAEGDCYLCVPPDPGIEAIALSASKSALYGTAPAEALHTFTLDSGASRCFFCNNTTITPLPAPVAVSLADPSGGPVFARSSNVLPYPEVLSGSLSGLHLPSFSTNLDLPVLRLHSDRGGEFSSHLLRDFCRGEEILQSFTLPASPQQNGIAERRIGLVMEVARTSMIHAAAPHFLWPFAVRYAAHQLNLWPRVSLPETSPTLRWTGEVGDASVFRVWGSRAFVHDTTADKLSSRAIPCVFLGFPTDAPGWQFYHPTSRAVFCPLRTSRAVPFYRLFPYRTAPLPPPRRSSSLQVPLWTPPPSGSCSLRCVPAEEGGVAANDTAAARRSPRLETPPGFPPRPSSPPLQWVAVDSGDPGGGEPAGVEPEGAESGGNEPEGVGSGGPEPEGAEPGGAEPGGVASGSNPSARGSAGASPCWRHWKLETLELEALALEALELEALALKALALEALELEALVLEALAGGTGAGGTGARGAGAGGTGAGDTEACGTGIGGTAQQRPFFLPPPQLSPLPPDFALRQVLRLPSSTAPPPPFLCPPPDPSQTQLQPDSPQQAPSPYTSQPASLTERREPASRRASPARTVRRVPRPCHRPLPGTHVMALRSSSVPLRVPLPSPPPPSLPDIPDLESDRVRTASPIVTRLLATVVTDPSFESTAAPDLVAELVDSAAACRLDYAASLVAESESDCPPSVAGECALGTDVLEDRQEELDCLAAAVPHLVAMLLAPEGDPDALDIPTPRSYAEAITGPYSSQWQTAMDAEMASWKSTGTYVDEVPPPGVNIVDGMWIFRVKRPSGSPPVFKARYVAQGFSQRQGVDFFQTFSPTPKMTTLRVLLHVAAQRDYELHSLDFSTAFLQGSLHEEIWLRHPCGFTGSFPEGTQWSLRRPVYSLRQAPREWHDTVRTTLAALGFAPSTADPSLFLRTDTSLPPFYILVYVDDLVFATADTEALALVKSELQKRHTCTDLVSWRSTRSSSVLSSSCEAEIYAGAMAAQELRWLTYLLIDLGERPRSPPVLYVDNKEMIALC